ncbi:MAG: glycoside hydrolase family 55 protein [Phycisphaerae bacterium]|nr:glycoside hydrolase family 55 protein [Phycisphaerae bacterium]
MPYTTEATVIPSVARDPGRRLLRRASLTSRRYIYAILTLLLAGYGPARAERPPIVFPDDANVINVTRPPYNARGDGSADDTAAINAALRDHNLGTFEGNVTFVEDPETGERIRKNSASGRPGEAWTVYLPEGTYRVSDTLIPRDPYDPAMSQSTVRLIGAGVGRTVIRLADETPGYGRPGRPKNVVQTGNAFGAKANSGFGNYVQHLTIDVGRGNPGAVGIQFDVANMGSIDHVRIVSSDPARAGWAGLAFYNIAGAGLVKNLEVEGFDYGIFLGTGDVGVNNIAFENITLSGQREAGLFNRGKNIQVHRLRSTNDVPALRTALPYTATILIDAVLQGPGEGSAVRMMEPSFLHVRDLAARGYDKTIETGDGALKPDVTDPTLDEWWTHDAPYQTPETASLRLPIKMTPEYHNSDLDQWANVTAFGATVNDDRDDDAPGIQAAIDSGKPVVYFPKGDYTIRSDVVVRGGVRKIDFLFPALPAREVRSGRWCAWETSMRRR